MGLGGAIAAESGTPEGQAIAGGLAIGKAAGNMLAPLVFGGKDENEK